MSWLNEKKQNEDFSKDIVGQLLAKIMLLHDNVQKDVD